MYQMPTLHGCCWNKWQCDRELGLGKYMESDERYLKVIL